MSAQILYNLLILFAILLSVTVKCFNLAPQPSLTLKQPLDGAAAAKKNRSTYFGYAIVLREGSILTGAPRAVPALPTKQAYVETGAVYKYNITTGLLSAFNFDKSSNIEAFDRKFVYDRKNQGLGAAMDGGKSDSDGWVVCAPQLSAERKGMQYMHGVCYWSANTLQDEKKLPSFRTISQLSLSASKQQKVRGNYYRLGEQGFSVHATPGNQQFLLGAPGVDEWKGTVVLYNVKKNVAISPYFAGQSYAYTGYAVGSGYLRSSDTKQIIYVATCPNAKSENKIGQAYLYTYNPKAPPTIYQVLSGEQYGEFFGYAVLVDDINGDGLDDVLLTAPQHIAYGEVDVGAVYVFINQKFWLFKQQLLISPFKDNGRFGTTISKLGDINLDGYNDIAIGAPFVAQHGAVAIYLGGPHGLRSQPSQIVNISSLAEGMFGHALSKGVDIDGNGFNDLVVGAPNADSIFLYKAYPVVNINATIRTLQTQISTVESELQFEICFNIKTNSTLLKYAELELQISIDKKLQRVKIAGNQGGEMKIVVLAFPHAKCQIYNAMIVFQPRHIFVPIFFELEHGLKRDARRETGEGFCADCALVDPSSPTISRTLLQYRHGCRGEVCNVDLQLTNRNIPARLILGLNNSFPLTYMIYNVGEKAYDAQLTVTTSLNLNIAKIPASCAEETDVQRKIICKLGTWEAFTGSIELQLIYDISNIVGAQEVIVNATVCSTGNEKTPEDNRLLDSIKLYTHAQVAIIELNTKEFIDVQRAKKSANMATTFELHNNGPSTLSELYLWTTMPVAFSDSRKASHTRNFTFIPRIFAKVYMDGYVYPPLSFEVATNTTNVSTHFEANEVIKLYDLPVNRTRFISCQQQKGGDVERTNFDLLCVQSQLRLPQLRPGQNITLLLRYTMQIDVITRLMANNTDYLVPMFDLQLQMSEELNGELIITKYLKPFVLVRISKPNLLSIYVAAIIGGLIFLVLLTWGLRKAGFFNRQTKEDMEKLYKEKEEKERMREEIYKCINGNNVN